MNNLIKAALLPALTQLAGRASTSLSVSTGAYAGVDVSTGQPFTGLQGRLKSPGIPAWFGPSIEGDSLGSAFPNSSFEVNAGTRGDGV